jgi:tRNA dimethylallyltransferase
VELARVVVLAGPTAAGKSARAVELALAADAVVLSADAMQVYRGFDVGTGKVTAAERRGVPHFGLDLVDATEPYDAAAWATLADEVVRTHPRVVVAGGTTLWLRSWLYGLVETPPVDPGLRAALEALPDPHAALAEVDPALAARLHPHDRLRVVRGLEVFHQTGRRLSELQAAHGAATPRFPFVVARLDREDLFERIERRVHQMLADGYLAEVRGLLERGVPPECRPMRSLGYRHLTEHLLGGLPLEEAVRRTIRDTRHFARKQRTWMRSLGWPLAPDDEPLLAALR